MKFPEPMPQHAYRDPAKILEDKQEAEAAERKRKQGRPQERQSAARQRAEALFSKGIDN